jgi:hypothetical protein
MRIPIRIYNYINILEMANRNSPNLIEIFLKEM